MKFLPTAFLLVLLSSLFAPALSAQPRSTVRSATAPTRALPKVVLSEVTKFGNLEVPSYDVMPFGEDFFVATTVENSQGFTFGGSAVFNELLALRLYRYSASLKQRSEIQVPWPDEPREHIGIVSLGEHFIWTFATRRAREGEMELSAEVLDARGKLVAKHKLMDVDRKDYNGLATLDEYSASRRHYVRVYAEQSDNRILSSRDDERATINIAVFNEAGEAVANDRKRLNCNRDQLQLLSVAVDDDGRAYVLAKVLGNTKGRERSGASDATIYLYTLEPGAAEITPTEVRINGQYIQGASLVPSVSGQAPTVVGLYSDKVGRRIRGFFSSDDLQDGALLKPIPFSADMLQAMGSRITTRVGGELAIENEFVFRDALRLSDGRLSLLLESYRIISNNRNGFYGPGGYGLGSGLYGPGYGYGYNNNLTYIYQEGLVLNFTPAGEYESLFVVPKMQSTQSPNLPYLRMNLVEFGGRPAAIYNDNPKNFARDLDKRTKPVSLSQALAIIAYGDGEAGAGLTRAPLFGRQDADKVLLIPSSARRLKDGSVVFLATRYKTFGKNELRFGLIEPTGGARE